MQNRNRLQAHRAPDHHRPGALVHHHARPRIDLDLDRLTLSSSAAMSSSGAAAISTRRLSTACARAEPSAGRWPPPSLGGMKVGVVQAPR
jgi:hypothetical protein